MQRDSPATIGQGRRGDEPIPGGGEAPPTEPVGAEATPTPCEVRVSGEIPTEAWNRIGTKLVPKLRGAGSTVHARIGLQTTCHDRAAAEQLATDLRQLVAELGLSGSATVELS